MIAQELVGCRSLLLSARNGTSVVMWSENLRPVKSGLLKFAPEEWLPLWTIQIGRFVSGMLYI